MEFLTPMIGLYAAAATVPLLLLLYFLKLRRQEMLVSSTLLWKRAVQDLQVNAPFQKLRRNLLLLLQLLTLAAILLALTGPVLALRRGPGQRFVLLIDRSASMNATDVEPTRLDAAKKQAKVFIESMRGGSALSWRDQSDHAMVIAFDQRASVVCSFTADKRQLMTRIDAIEPSDGVSRLGEAVTVARAFAQSSGAEAAGGSAVKSAQLVLFSDGRIADLDGIVVGADELVFHRIGESRDNVGVTAMNARRSYERPEEVEVFASIENFGTEPVTRDVQLSIGGNVQAVRSVTVPPCEMESGDKPFSPGQTTLNFSLTHGEAGVLEVCQLGADSLSCDDAAWSVLDPPKRLAVLLVTQGNPVLESALKACPIARFDPCTPAGFDAMDPVAFTAGQQYDVVVLDNHVPAHLPPCRYLVFGPPPGGIDANSPRELENQLIIDWRSQHPVLQYVNMTNLFAARSHCLELPRDAEVLAEFNESPAVAVLHRRGGTFLLVNFDILQSNWPFEPSFVLFCYNALSYLGAQDRRAAPARKGRRGADFDRERIGRRSRYGDLSRRSQGGCEAGPGRHGPLPGDASCGCLRRRNCRSAAAILCGESADRAGESDRAAGEDRAFRRGGRRARAGSPASQCAIVALAGDGGAGVGLHRVAGVQSEDSNVRHGMRARRESTDV